MNPDGERSTHRHKAKGGSCLPASLALAVTLTLLVMAAWGCGERDVPPLREEDANGAFAELVPGLSADQSRAVADYGYPDHFFISMDPETRDRVERWIYYARGKALDFDNGRLFGEEPVEDKSAEYPPTSLRPQDFGPLLTAEEATAMLGEPLFTHEVEESLLPENVFVVYEKAVLLYREGRLIGVDTQVHPPDIPGASGT
ncbi:MAG: hypothetical protein H5T73_01140 [Actinobacteria bacterium]|nr:hypothetical protein [Actinomycetota bacterium]